MRCGGNASACARVRDAPGRWRQAPLFVNTMAPPSHSATLKSTRRHGPRVPSRRNTSAFYTWSLCRSFPPFRVGRGWGGHRWSALDRLPQLEAAIEPCGVEFRREKLFLQFILSVEVLQRATQEAGDTRGREKKNTIRCVIIGILSAVKNRKKAEK